MNSETIRKAVELADGWKAYKNYVSTLGFTGSYELLIGSQYALDALAAQLVRQVDALDVTDLEIYSNTTYIGTDHDDNICRSGDGRSENTINAIVDSGVLK